MDDDPPNDGSSQLDIDEDLTLLERIERFCATGALVLRLVLQNGEAFLLTPMLLSRTVNLLPTVALMAQLGLGTLLGLPGVLLALPLVVVLQVLCREVVVRGVMDRWTA